MQSNPTPVIQDEVSILLDNVSKYYKLYKHPKDRFKEALSLTGKKYHKKFYATKNLDLQINKGEIIGIVGRNGSGKSTLLKLITGVLTPDEGSIQVNGKISALLELGAGFNPEFTGIENIFFYGMILGFSKQEMQEKLDDIIAFADIGDFINQPLRSYSSGMKSRLGFAVAIYIEPEILILDEVLAVGDVLFKRKCYAKMEEFFQSGKTILYVSHNLNSIKELCTRAIFLNSGKILLDSDPNTVAGYYEKFIFAEEKNKNKILQEIEDLNRSSSKETSQDPKVIPEEDSYVIPGFKPKSTLIYDESKVKIFDIHIKNVQNKTVNALKHGEKYFYCYKLKFLNDYEHVNFAMQFQTEKGLKITSAGSLTFNKTIQKVHKGEIYSICWEFICLLTTGTYYANIGVTSIIDHEKVFLNRITDALAFKVLPMEKVIHGIVSLQQIPTYKIEQEN